jgi:hypothetical protein
MTATEELPLEAEKPEKVRHWSESSLSAALAMRYAAPEYAFLPQARNCTGYGRRVRTADGLAMSLYPSRGLHLHGFEIKCSRSDWLNEKKDPEKAEAIQQYCDFWWLVVSDPKIVHAGELPLNWGMLAPRGQKLVVIKEASLNTEVKPIDRQFLAGLLRKAAEKDLNSQAIREARSAGMDEGLKNGRAQRQWEVDRAQTDAKNLKQTIADFERLSGIRLDTYQGGQIGSYVGVAQTRDWDHFRKRLDQARLGLLNLADEMNATINATRAGEMTDWMI